MEEMQIQLEPIGRVLANEQRGQFQLEILEAFRPALHRLASCSHAIVLWWADHSEGSASRGENLVVDLPYASGERAGVFATRSEFRPNPIAITTSQILAVDEDAGIVNLAWIDAFDSTLVLDIKPYLPMSDLVQGAEYPEWLEGCPASMEEAAEFFSDPENVEQFS